MRSARFVAFCWGLAWTCLTFGAHAQDTAAAIALFDRGVAALERGDTAAACPDLAESQRLVPQRGTLFQLAKCEAAAGKIASADAHYQQYLAEVRALPPDKLAKLQTRIGEVEAARTSFVGEIPTLTLMLPANAPANVEVIRDGTTLTAVTLGVAIPVDPGEHVVTTQAPGGPLHEQRFVVERKETKTVQLEIELPPAKLMEPLVQGKPVKPIAPVESSSSGLRTGGFVVLGLGGAGMLVWAVAGGVAMNNASTVENVCPKDPCANPSADAKARAAWNSGSTAANVATAGLVVGVVGVVAGGSMWLGSSRPKSHARANSTLDVGVIEAGPTGALFGVKGVF